MINFIFHKIFNRKEEIDDLYNVDLQLFRTIYNKAKAELGDNFRLYFDDGSSSFLDLVFSELKKDEYARVNLAVVTGLVEKPGFLTFEDLRKMQDLGISISSHGTSHSALAITKSASDRSTPKNGYYRTGTHSFEPRLSENEVLYQYIESKVKLNAENINVNEFVFPYGLYNDTSIRLNYEYGIYKFLSTCDEYVDEGQELRPRILVDNQTDVEALFKKIDTLPKRSDEIQTIRKI